MHELFTLQVILIFGICGAMRCEEITNTRVCDVEDLGDKFIVSIPDNKNDYPGQFIIGNLFYDKIKHYISLRPKQEFTERFFIHYINGKCQSQNIGRHKIGEVPQLIAKYLNLRNPERYTGHCFRRTAATLLSDAGGNIQMLKQLGRWRSDLIAQGYIENSLHNRQMIFNTVTQQTVKNTIPIQNISGSSKNVTSPSVSIPCANSSIPSTSSDGTTMSISFANSPSTSEIFNSPSVPIPSANVKIPSTSTTPTSTSISSVDLPASSTRTLDLDASNENDSSVFDIDWSDFQEEFTLDNIDSASSKHATFILPIIVVKN